jgi:very-short-patch-repair endonuclease
MERRFLELGTAAKLPAPSVNVVIEGFEVDLVWPAARLVVELDSWGFHRSPRSFEDDRSRDVRLQLAGWRVVRITWRRLEHEPDAVVGEICALLGRPDSALG